MTNSITRRSFLQRAALALGSASLMRPRVLLADAFSKDQIAPFRTPYKFGKLVLSASADAQAFDSKAVDDPFVFFHDGAFQMLYIGFDGSGYQSGLARSTDLLQWERVALVAPRNPNSKYTRYNVALSCLLREEGLTAQGNLKKVNGRYLGAWHAYPNPGYEEGAAVIGLAWSDNLLHWELTEPILFPSDGALWEHGGLYRPNLVEQDGVYYLYYNAKTDPVPHAKGLAWHEQTGVATSKDLRHWTRYKGNPILPDGGPGSFDSSFASNPFVVRYKDLWGMYYYGLDSKFKARELFALGKDPFHFSKADEFLVEPGVPGTVDETYAHKPCVIYHGGALYHFYCAVSGKYPNEIRGISVARSSPFSGNSVQG
jgi:predicted GH43/DUF377 family glycosyl hydrolase